MHNSYYFLKQAAAALDTRLRGFSLVSCFSQSKDELLVEFNNATESFFVRASLLPELQSLSFPNKLTRARKNSVDLFNELLMKKVISAHAITNDRSLLIELEDTCGILFKMHGSQSNVMCVMNNKTTDVFRNSLQQDLDIEPTGLARELDWSENAFRNAVDIRKHFFTLGKEVWTYLDEKNFKTLPQHEQWKALLDVQGLLESGIYYHVEFRSKLIFTLLPYGRTMASFNDPLEAVTAFASAYSSGYALERERGRLISRLEAAIKKTQQYLAKTEGQLDAIRQDNHFQVWGDLLMANMKSVKPGEVSTILENLYDGNKLLQIKLNPQLSPQKNAEAYYRKAKNRAIELGRLEQLLRERRQMLSKLESELVTVKSASTLKEFRSLSTEISAEKPSAQTIKLPYRELVFEGFRIWIGKDAASNDELTFKFGFKEDLWLHAKDVSGSHVLIKHQAGKNFPKPVIERAAQLAAFFSKRKTDSLCPVAVTPKKLVRKRKGDPAGAVVVEREKVVMVEPKGLE